MKRLFLQVFVAFGLLAAVFAAPAQAAAPAFAITHEAAEPVIDHTQTPQSISKISGPAAFVDSRVMGVTTSKSDFTVSADYNIGSGNGRVVIVPTAVQIHLRRFDTVIHVLEKYGVDSCEYRVILEHERRHAAIFAAFTPEDEAALKAIDLNLGDKLVGVSEHEAEALFMARLQDQVRATLKDIALRKGKEHGGLDTRAEALKTSALCAFR